MSYENENNWGLMIFKDTFEYLINGDLTNDEFCELMTCIYNAREYEDFPDEKGLSKNVRLVWKTLKNNIHKSIRNAKHYAKNKSSKQEIVDTSTGEVFIPTDEPMTSELTVDPVLEDEQSTNVTLTEFIQSRPEGIMQCPQWNNFVALYPDAEKIQKTTGITDLSAVTLYGQLRNNAFAIK